MAAGIGKIKLDFDGSQATAELIFELGRIVGDLDRGELLHPIIIASRIEQAVAQFQLDSKDPAVGTLIQRIRELSD